MPRWEPQARERLRDVALQLYLERGYESVTVAEITERAGLTRRTFFRYFTDKRDVLFAGSEQLPGALAAAVRQADGALSPFEAMLAALAGVGELLIDRVPQAALRRAVINTSPELQERERTKFAAVASALAEALVERGTAAPGSGLLAQVGVAIFQAAFERWTERPELADFPNLVRATTIELAAHFTPEGVRA
jgi:AcrR family transcriptional regulator